MTTQALTNMPNKPKGGPKTTYGKLISSKNAIKHGLLASHLLIRGEKASDLDTFRESVYEAVDPQGALEELLAEKIIASIWRWRRLVKVEVEIFDNDSFGHRGSPQEAFDGSGEQLMTLTRYEANLEKTFYRALHELERIQAMRLGRPVLAPIAIEVNTGPHAPSESEFVS